MFGLKKTIRIKFNLFEGLLLCYTVPTLIAVLPLFFSILFTFMGMELKYWLHTAMGFVALLGLLCFNFLILFVYISLSRKYIILTQDCILFENKGIRYSDIAYLEYFVCKWYMLPFALVYKDQRGGQLWIQTRSGRRECILVAYKDYKKIKKRLHSQWGILIYEK